MKAAHRTELVVLRSSTAEDEEGAWLNSRGRRSGVIGLWRSPGGGVQTIRRALPAFVTDALTGVYVEAALVRGCPDLVIWSEQRLSVRLIEVKCPHWDRSSLQQERFMSVAVQRGIPTEVVEWEFAGDADPKDGLEEDG
jgi:hypothetical protein